MRLVSNILLLRSLGKAATFRRNHISSKMIDFLCDVASLKTPNYLPGRVGSLGAWTTTWKNPPALTLAVRNMSAGLKSQRLTIADMVQLAAARAANV